MKIKRQLVRFLLVVAILTVTAGGYALARYDPVSAVTLENRLALLPEKYQPPYWSLDFMKESNDPHVKGEWITLDYGGYRHTVPAKMPTVYAFGNSVMWGAMVPDEYTIPSQLQLILGAKYVVLNRATSGPVAMEYLELEQVLLSPGDIVIFLDGISELPAVGEENPQVVTERYAKYISLARSYSLSHGARFYHFLQPILYSISPVSADERDFFTASQALFSYHQFSTRIPTYWPGLQTVAEHDLTHLLDTFRRFGGWAYIDDIHTTPAANAIIAVAIASVLQDREASNENSRSQ